MEGVYQIHTSTQTNFFLKKNLVKTIPSSFLDIFKNVFSLSSLFF